MWPRLFPPRPAEERKADIRSAATICAAFAIVALTGLGLFLFAGELPPAATSSWSMLCWGGLIVGSIAAYLSVQSLLELVIAATIGPERTMAIFAALVLVGGLAMWLAR